MTRAAAVPARPAARATRSGWAPSTATALAVSYIQSIYWEYGSGCVLPRTGIHWQNRGVSFSLDPKALNPLEPGRKPFHTLNPALRRASTTAASSSYGAMGGDGQPQFQAPIFSRYALRHGPGRGGRRAALAARPDLGRRLAPR